MAKHRAESHPEHVRPTGNPTEDKFWQEMHDLIVHPGRPHDLTREQKPRAHTGDKGTGRSFRPEVDIPRGKDAGEIYRDIGILLDTHQTQERRLEAAWNLVFRNNVSNFGDGKGNTYQITGNMSWKLSNKLEATGEQRTVSLYKYPSTEPMLQGTLSDSTQPEIATQKRVRTTNI